MFLSLCLFLPSFVPLTFSYSLPSLNYLSLLLFLFMSILFLLHLFSFPFSVHFIPPFVCPSASFFLPVCHLLFLFYFDLLTIRLCLFSCLSSSYCIALFLSSVFFYLSSDLFFYLLVPSFSSSLSMLFLISTFLFFFFFFIPHSSVFVLSFFRFYSSCVCRFLYVLSSTHICLPFFSSFFVVLRSRFPNFLTVFPSVVHFLHSSVCRKLSSPVHSRRCHSLLTPTVVGAWV